MKVWDTINNDHVLIKTLINLLFFLEKFKSTGGVLGENIALIHISNQIIVYLGHLKVSRSSFIGITS